MSDQERNTAAGTAEELLDALRSAAGDAATRETIAELGARARAIVDGLSRVSRSGFAGAASSPRPSEEPTSRGQGGEERSASGGDFASLHRGVEVLRTGVAEVGDLLEATIERLETVEAQLGGPGEEVERRLADGLVRCERVLAGIEHRLDAARTAAAAIENRGAARRPASLGAVLVVAQDSSRRAALCLGLEREGMRAVAAVDLVSAITAAKRNAVDVALLADAGGRSELLDDWVLAVGDGLLPPAVVLGDPVAATPPGFDFASDAHGSAALAASLSALARRTAPRETPATGAGSAPPSAQAAGPAAQDPETSAFAGNSQEREGTEP